MPRAGDTAVFDGAECDGCVSVGAKVVDGVDFSLMADQGDAVSFKLEGFSFSFFEFG